MNNKGLLSVIVAFILGLVLGYFICIITVTKTSVNVDTTATTNDIATNNVSAEQNVTNTELEQTLATISDTTVESGEEEISEEIKSEDIVENIKEPVKPIVNGMFSWHKFKEKYLPILEKYNIDQVYQCYDSQIREGDYDAIKESIKLLEGYDVWLLTGDPSWTAEDMLQKVTVAQEIGGLKGVVFDVEPETYDETYLNNVKMVCEQSELPIMFCVSYRADVNILKEVLSVVDGLLVMNYDVGNEYANIKDLIPVSEQYDVALITVYELQPSNHDIGLHSYHTYDGDIDSAISNFEEQFKGEDNIGIAYHYIKYVNTD